MQKSKCKIYVSRQRGTILKFSHFTFCTVILHFDFKIFILIEWYVSYQFFYIAFSDGLKAVFPAPVLAGVSGVKMILAAFAPQQFLSTSDFYSFGN